MDDNQVKKNSLGYYTLKKVPDKKTLESYYHNKYYQAEEKYSSKYSTEEISYIKNKIDLKFKVINRALKINKNKHYSLLELGAGEGWTLDYFNKNGWGVTGIDYSDHGCKFHNPTMLKNLVIGDLDNKLKQIVKSNQKFDVVWLDNVLEHVPDPKQLLKLCRQVIKKTGLLVIEVPNDFSTTQMYLLKKRFVTKKYWIVSPDHISYFSLRSLNRLCNLLGFKNIDAIGEFPIDFFLFNRDTNYIENGQKGKECHNARVKIENFLSTLPEDQNLKFYRTLSGLGLGRQIIGFYKPK